MARRVLSASTGSTPPSSPAKKKSSKNTPLKTSKAVGKTPVVIAKTTTKKPEATSGKKIVSSKPIATKKPATPKTSKPATINKKTTSISKKPSVRQQEAIPTEPKVSVIIKPTLTDAINLDTKARSAERVIKQLRNKKKVAPKKTLGVGLPPSMILVDDFITPGTPLTVLPRQKSRFAVAVAIFSLAVMTTAGLASFGPSHADTDPANEADMIAEHTAAQEIAQPEPATTVSPGNFSLLGKVTTVQGDSVTILTVSPNGSKKNAKEYTVSFAPEASFFHRIAMKDENLTSYKVVKGDKTEIQPGYFLSLTTDDNTAKSEAITALTINYEEMNPFGE